MTGSPTVKPAVYWEGDQLALSSTLLERSIRGPQRGGSRTGFLINLNRGFVSVDSDNFTDEQIVSDTALTIQNISIGCLAGAFGRAPGSLTNSYMAQPIMFSATTTGPETEKMEP